MPRESELSLRIAEEGAHVIAVVTSTEVDRHFLQAGRSRATVVCVPHNRWPATSIERRPDAVIVHLDPNIFTEVNIAPFLAHLQQRCGGAAIATYCDLDAQSIRLLTCAIRFGVQATWIRGHDHLPARLKELLHQNGASAVAATVLDAIEPVPSSLRRAALRCLQHAFNRVLTVSALGNELRVSRRTLLNRFRAVGYPPPATFITWCRLLISARLLEDSSVSVADVARRLHFISASQYRGMLRRYAGLTPTELRRLGALATLATRFRRCTASPVLDTVLADAPVSPSRTPLLEPASHRMTG